VKLLCQKLGFNLRCGLSMPAVTRFAENHLRHDGSVFHLQKVLGHTTLEMTRRCANLMTEDLQAVHQRVTLLTTGFCS
jgi:hypothetical protein